LGNAEAIQELGGPQSSDMIDDIAQKRRLVKFHMPDTLPTDASSELQGVALHVRKGDINHRLIKIRKVSLSGR